MEQELPFYELDEDTRTLLCTVLELAFLTSNLQINSTDSQVVADICFQTAARFGIDIELKEIDSLPVDSLGDRQIDVSRLPFKIQILDKDAK
jgi:hypothetical protein